MRVTSSGRGNYIIKSIVVDNVSSNSVSVVSGFLQGTILRSSHDFIEDVIKIWLDTLSCLNLVK